MSPKHERLQKRKHPHSLHLAETPEEFLLGFEAVADISIRDLTSETVEAGGILSVTLAGSIPLGIGSPTSDVDLLVLVTEATVFRGKLPNTRYRQLFGGHAAAKEFSLALYERVLLVNGIEVNIQYVDATKFDRACQTLTSGGSYISFAGPDIIILSRMKVGWCVWDCGSTCLREGPFYRSNALEIHSAIRYMTFAIQDIDDALSALRDNLALSTHLSRMAVEKAFQAYIASKGIAFAGAKWLRLLKTPRMFPDDSDHSMLHDLFAEGTRLLFPGAFSSIEIGEKHIQDVTSFIRELRHRSFSRPDFKMALKLSGQINSLVAPE